MYKRQDIDINSLVTTTASLIEPEARAAGVEIQLNLDENTRQASVNPVQIQQVIVNLGRNAIEALESSQRDNALVTIATEQSNPDLILVTVQDNGDGLSEELQSTLFQPHITSKESGMGLGLSICFSIIEATGGELWYESHNDVGATFHFTIPTDKKGDH